MHDTQDDLRYSQIKPYTNAFRKTKWEWSKLFLIMCQFILANPSEGFEDTRYPTQQIRLR